jgi:formylglycine-generating enzyme required for sulfatase activity
MAFVFNGAGGSFQSFYMLHGPFTTISDIPNGYSEDEYYGAISLWHRRTPSAPEEPAPEADYTNSVGGTMIAISAGTFDMGCTPGQEASGDCEAHEYPVHTVTLTRDFYVGETEVTQDQWQAVMGSNPSHFSGCGGECPVEWINWQESVEFANALSILEGRTPAYTVDGSDYTLNIDADGYRLPTEAEWEYTARCGEDLLYAGSNDINDVENGGPNSVGLMAPNACGTYDMSGNVWEWTWDWYDSGYYSVSASVDPINLTGSWRVFRGGSWSSADSTLRVSERGRQPDTDTDGRGNNVGLRLFRTAP